MYKNGRFTKKCLTNGSAFYFISAVFCGLSIAVLTDGPGRDWLLFVLCVVLCLGAYAAGRGMRDLYLQQDSQNPGYRKRIEKVRKLLEEL